MDGVKGFIVEIDARQLRVGRVTNPWSCKLLIQKEKTFEQALLGKPLCLGTQRVDAARTIEGGARPSTGKHEARGLDT
jgi:hypothetical protein